MLTLRHLNNFIRERDLELDRCLNKDKTHAEIIRFVTLSRRVTLLKQGAVFEEGQRVRANLQSSGSLDVMDVFPLQILNDLRIKILLVIREDTMVGPLNYKVMGCSVFPDSFP